MSVLLIEGFETSADQTDVYARGLQTATSPVNVNGLGVLPVPARTGAAGTALALRGPYSSSTALPCSAVGTPDFGMIPLGASIYSLWASGGFALGLSASFNSLNTLQIAPTDSFQICYDGSTYYWAIIYTGSAYQVAYSPDLKSWTVTAAQPSGMLVNCTIAVTGTGATATVIVGSKSGSTAFQPQYTTNLGATWTGMSIGASSNLRNVVPTGNATTPYACVGFTSGTGFRVYTFSAIGATPVGLNSTPALTGNVTYGAAWTTVSNGYILACGIGMGAGASTPVSGGTSVIGWCNQSNNPATAGNWSNTTSVAAYLNSACWFNGNIYACGYGGIWQYNTSNSTWTQVVNTGSTTIWSIAANAAGTALVAVGTDATNNWQAAMWSSSNGTTWTKQNRFVLTGAAGTQTNQFSNVFWDGSRFVAASGLNNNMIAVSTDGVAWTVIYYPEYAETTGTASLSFLGVYSGLQNPGTGIFTPWGTAAGNVSAVGLTAAAVASSARTVTAVSVTAGALANSGLTTSAGAVNAAVGQTQPATLTHYYELVFTAVAGSPNLFNVQLMFDNATLGTIGQFQLAATTDTGAAQAYLNLPRNGNFTVLDDIYLTNFAGSTHNNKLGVQRIYPMAPSSAVTTNFSAQGSGSNAAIVATPLSNSEGYVYSTAATTQDVYGTTNSAPGAGTVINAVQVEGFLSSYNTNSAGSGQVGIQSNGVQKLGSIVSTNNTPARAVAIAEVDPNTGLPWTSSGLNAADIVLGKTS